MVYLLSTSLSKAYAISLMWSIEARQQLIVRRSTWLEEGSKYIRPRGPNPGHPRTSRLITVGLLLSKEISAKMTP